MNSPCLSQTLEDRVIVAEVARLYLALDIGLKCYLEDCQE